MEVVRDELKHLQAQRAAIEAEINERSARLNGPGQPGMQGSLLDKEGFPRADIDVHAVRVDRNAVIRLSNDHKALSQQMEGLLHRLHELARQAGVTSLGGGAANVGSSGPSSSSGGAPGGQPAAPATPTPAVAPSSGPEQHDDKRPRLEGSGAAATVAAATAAAAAGSAAAAGAAAPLAPALRPFAVVDEVSDASPAAAAGIQLGDQLCRFGSAVAGSGGGSSDLQAVAAELQQHEGRPVAAVFLRAGQPVTLSLTPQRWAGRGLLGCHLRPL